MFLFGCSYNAATGRREIIAISTSEEVALGQKAHNGILKEFTLSSDETLNEKVNRIGKRLVRVSDRQDYQYHFYVIDKKEFNAFTTPGGHIYFHAGLLEHLSTDDQIAGVLAHEIGHCAAKHTIKKYQAALGYNFLGNLVLNRIGGGAQQIANLSSGVIMNLAFSAYGRKDEYEADRLAIKYMYLAGYDIDGMIGVLKVLEQASKGASKTPLILRSHPYLKDRITAAKQEIVNIKVKFGE